MRKAAKLLSMGALLFGAVGCATSAAVPEPVTPLVRPDCRNDACREDAVNAFRRGVEEMRKADAASSGWTEETCRVVASLFTDAARSQSITLEAQYNAAIVYERCDDVSAARGVYQAILAEKPSFYQARGRLARIDVDPAYGGDVDAAIRELTRAVEDASYRDPEALVELGRLQMRRNNVLKDSDGPSDFVRARKNFMRALVASDGFMPAVNQLALYYLESAKRAAGTSSATVSRGKAAAVLDERALDLALLVASQGIKRAPNDPSLHNTLGLVLVELGDLTKAARQFDEARKLDKRFFEAHMNFASVNMMFRGFHAAEGAYRSAVALHPDDYDARLGLALSLRGQIDGDPNPEVKLAEAEKEIEKAKSLVPARPEAYFNHAILVQEYRGRGEGQEREKALEHALQLYGEFVSRAKGKAEFAETVDDVVAVPAKPESECMTSASRADKACKRGRLLDVRDMLQFTRESSEPQAKLIQ
ncbi:MAG: tetratricopeptide repeat protein [Polyangiaceae bacterium]|nr:tetratricopeptide repeat protein [Polyangiaceae bacterium]